MIAIVAISVVVVDEDRHSRVVLLLSVFAVDFEVSIHIEHCRRRLSESHLVAIHERVERNL